MKYLACESLKLEPNAKLARCKVSVGARPLFQSQIISSETNSTRLIYLEYVISLMLIKSVNSNLKKSANFVLMHNYHGSYEKCDLWYELSLCASCTEPIQIYIPNENY